MSSNETKLDEAAEVVYDKGATPLFLAIEETRWRDAFDIADEYPEQIAVWVRSMGAEETNFGWALWRRLPIHEACRRQPPAWFISMLLSKFPECASAITQFGQLPLHLAVECGAAPEVVNLLVVAYWDGIIECDQSGRTPMEILDSNELLEQEESRVVFESLQRCFKAYTGFQNRTQDVTNTLQRKHKSTLVALAKKHDAEITCEHEKQEEIRNVVRQMESKIEELNGFIKDRDEKIATFTNEQDTWMGRTKELATATTSLKEKLNSEKSTVEAFVDAVHSRDRIIAERDLEIERLSRDLRNIYVVQERDVAETLIQAERSMRAMVSTQITLQNQLLGQTKGLRTLLQKRGIPLPREGTKASQGATAYFQEDEEEDEFDNDDAANAASAAAGVALQLPTMASA